MPSAWGRPPRNEIWKDLQALALWILIIGVVGYVLFPNFFKDIYIRLSDPVTETTTLNDNYTLNNAFDPYTDLTTNQSILGPDLSIGANSLNNVVNDEVSTGYWAIFVSEGEFKELSVSTETYAFLLRLIESDQKTTGKSTVILAANGQIRKFVVSEEIYSIINNIALIAARTK